MTIPAPVLSLRNLIDEPATFKVTSSPLSLSLSDFSRASSCRTCCSSCSAFESALTAGTSLAAGGAGLRRGAVSLTAHCGKQSQQASPPILLRTEPVNRSQAPGWFAVTCVCVKFCPHTQYRTVHVILLASPSTGSPELSSCTDCFSLQLAGIGLRAVSDCADTA